MFGESESESPRVPSPWDSLISHPPSPAPKGRNCPSPLSTELIPQLVPESDDGNVEYKLQLLSPSPARFARLVTQMKWRLLEGGGQAYYELGVADSGHLVGLPRDELEQSLETLEMMAGEIGASVIVVKEIEVPEVLVDFAAAHAKDWGDGSGKRSRRRDALMTNSKDDEYSASTLFSTETETETVSTTDVDEDVDEDMSITIVLQANGNTTELHQHSCTRKAETTNEVSIVSTELDESEDADDELSAPLKTLAKFSIDIEISSVYKPRPMKARMHHRVHHAQSIPVSGKNKRSKKHKFHHSANTLNDPKDNAGEQQYPDISSRHQKRREAKRGEKRKALLAVASHAVQHATIASETSYPAVDRSPDNTEELVSGLESLHVDDQSSAVLEDAFTLPLEDIEGDDDVFASPVATKPTFTSFKNSTGESHLDVNVGDTRATANDKAPRLIVEALVVRKMSLEEAFLDFGGFSLIC